MMGFESDDAAGVAVDCRAPIEDADRAGRRRISRLTYISECPFSMTVDEFQAVPRLPLDARAGECAS